MDKFLQTPSIKQDYSRQIKYIEILKSINQDHILELYLNSSSDHKILFQLQIDKLNQTYPGGLKSYYQNALNLLKNSMDTSHFYQNYNVNQPTGIYFELNKPEYIQKYQNIGLKQIQYTTFVLVAGGLGQRLGYPGIKLNIPFELLTRKSFLHYYIEYILAYQAKFCLEEIKIPLAIMTSDDTHEQTIQLLQKNNYFGMEQTSITIIKQQKVPAIIDKKAKFALIKDKLQIQTKPHGHGDVHMLLYKHRLIQKWQQQGKKWVIFFQDTNPLIFRAYPMLLGVSQDKDYDFNTIATGKKPEEAVGAILTLTHKQDQRKKLTINVQYNILQDLFKKIGGQPKNSQGNSLYPGNTNSFSIKISSYNEILNKSKGCISEFINPKYSDEQKKIFKSSSRLQLLMSDYPKLLSNCDKVGITFIPKEICFSTVKNDLKTATNKIKKKLSGQSSSTCEAQFNYSNRVMLRMCGAKIQQAKPCEIGQIILPMFPMIYISPNFATCYTELKKKVRKLQVTEKSSLIINSDCILEDVYIDGHCEISETGQITLIQTNKLYKNIIPLKSDAQPQLQIKGYDLI